MKEIINRIRGTVHFNFHDCCIILIILWPLIGSFFGVDMSDTGSYLYNYQHPFSESVSLFTFLATFIGAIWYRMTSFLGIWGLNLLEVFLEWASCYFIYKLLVKDIDKNVVLLGILISLILCDTYINIFNFHQLNMLLMIMSIYFLYNGLTEKKKLYFAISGAMIGASVFVRIPSILGLFLIVPIILWKYLFHLDRKTVLVYAKSFIYGFMLAVISMMVFYLIVFGFERVLSEIYRIFFLSSGGNSGYGTKSLILDLIKDTVSSLGIGIITLAAYMLLAYCLLHAFRDRKNKKFISFIYLIFIVLGCFLIFYAFYKMAPLPQGWAKLSPFGWSFFGMLLIFAIYFILKGMVSQKETEKRIAMLSVLGILLNYLVFTGSGVRFRHTILGMWILIPIALHFLNTVTMEPQWQRKVKPYIRMAVIVFCVFNTVFIFHYVSSVNMYDAENPLKLYARIHAPDTKLVLTTSRQADFVNDVLNELNNENNKERKLLIYGDSVLLYTLSDKEAYIRPWINVSSYTVQELRDDLNKKQESGEALPLVVLCRTSSYRGFDQTTYEEDLAQGNQPSAKKDVVNELLEQNKYQIVYENDYYTLYDTKEEANNEK